MGLGFETVLKELKKNVGAVAYREGWNGDFQSISLQVPDVNSANTLPYIYFEYTQVLKSGGICQRVPWVASHTDLLAEDWVVENTASD